MRKNLLVVITLIAFIYSGVSCGIFKDTSVKGKDPINYSNLKELDMPKDSITLKLNGEDLNLNTPVYLEKNRYYFCLTEIVDKLQGEIKKEDNKLIVSLLDSSFLIDLNNNTTLVNDAEYTLKKPLISQDKFYYIGFSDLAYLLNSYTRWDIDNKVISCNTQGDDIKNVTPYKSSIDQVGYLRFEDVALTTRPQEKDRMEKIRIMGNYLSKKGVPYHIAWIPHFVGANNSVDIDPMTRSDFNVAELVYTLDYLTQHNGSIGLHGYTHQSGNEESEDGYESGYRHPSTEEFRARLNKSIATAEYLSIPIDFYEAPHYSITPKQNKIAEEYFKVLYYPFEDNTVATTDLTKPQLSPYNKLTYYVSTPLNYVPCTKIDATIESFKAANTKNMGSLFYHPGLDFGAIQLLDEKGVPSYTYDTNSNLNKILNVLESKGFKMSKVSDIK
ncbi:MAG TPA: DUF2334 domain-containing protein [Clostridium sp.]